jgi:hypothetical protein
MPVFIDPKGHKTALGEFPTVSGPEWPRPGLIARANDALGAAIIAYAEKHRADSRLPESPWDPRRGEIFLRDLDEPEPPRDEVPKYRVKTPTIFIGCAQYLQNDVVPFDGWIANMWAVEAANESAARVMRYASRYGAGRTLQRPPYSGGKLNFENPELWGKPQSATHRGHFGGPSIGLGA